MCDQLEGKNGDYKKLRRGCAALQGGRLLIVCLTRRPFLLATPLSPSAAAAVKLCLCQGRSRCFPGSAPLLSTHREEVMDYIEQHRDDFAPFVEDDLPFEKARRDGASLHPLVLSLRSVPPSVLRPVSTASVASAASWLL